MKQQQISSKWQSIIQIQDQAQRQKLFQLYQSLRNSQQSPVNMQQQASEPIRNPKPPVPKQFQWPVYKKLLQYTLNRWPLALFGIIITILSGVATSIVPYQVGNILDLIGIYIQDPSTMDVKVLNPQLQEFLVVILVLGITTFLRFTSMQYLQEYLAVDLRTDIYNKFINNNMQFFQMYKSGEFISRLGTDITQAKSAVSNNLTFFLRNLVTIITNFIILFYMKWHLALALLTILPLYIAITIYFNQTFTPLVVQYQDIIAQMSGHIGQKFSSILMVKAFSTQQKELKHYKEVNTKALAIAQKRIFVQGVFWTSSQFLPVVGVAIVLWYGGKMIFAGDKQLTPGQLTSFIMYTTELANNTSGILSSYSNIIDGTSSIRKVFKMLQYQSSFKQGQGITPQINGQIAFTNVDFAYPNSKVQTFQNLSFKIKSGEYIGFVGQSGSGKSTIVKLIQKFYSISSGSIHFGPYKSQQLNFHQVRKQIGLVNQQATMFSGTIQQNITYGMDSYTKKQLYDAAQRSGAMDFIMNKTLFPDGLKTLLGQKGNNLSGGQRQRIAIARALIKKPKIIIFDQATSALDANTQKMVQQSIEKLALNSNDKVTIIVIAHRLSTIINADRILVMKQGKILQQGNHEELKQKRGYYFQLVEKQLQQV